MAYVKVCEDDTLEDIMELPLEEDNSLLLSTVTAQFPGAIGLKFKVQESGSMRGVRLVDGRLLAPADGNWDAHTYICTFPKAPKRKAEEFEDKKTDIEKDRKPDIDGSLQSKRRTIDLIVLGLPYSLDEKQMREYFSQFGELSSCEVKSDLSTGKSKGFGFIHFREYSSQLEALSRKHFIGGRLCEVKVPDNKSQTESAHRLFVGRLPEWMTEQDLNEYFSKFGDIADVYLPRHPFRGFAFVTFVDPWVSSTLMKESHVIKNHTVFLQEATPRVSKAKAQERREMPRGGNDARPQPAPYDPSAMHGGQAAAAQIAAAVAAALAQAGVANPPPSNSYSGQSTFGGYGPGQGNAANPSPSLGGYGQGQGGGYSSNGNSGSNYSSGFGSAYQGARGGSSDYRAYK